MKNSIWLIGAGQMAIEYCNVLRDLNCDFNVIGRGTKSANNFEKKTSKEVFKGGIKKALKYFDPPDNIIIAVGADQLFNILEFVLNQKI